jgi:hypothetical protein
VRATREGTSRRSPQNYTTKHPKENHEPARFPPSPPTRTTSAFGTLSVSQTRPSVTARSSLPSFRPGARPARGPTRD